ncbi:hypothetical protein TeGR_g6781 [Tetraparma gracilis]|uniref:NADPH-dependent FMN reductase-like domain-containing protein n=1 Tax=Tetraparma gracilis TaxID=2962635 RepID=A0ABQ6MHV3_9STRA|nr:hypothetical protein TeGR_g6781 [Tetraparma gracilis]
MSQAPRSVSEDVTMASKRILNCVAFLGTTRSAQPFFKALPPRTGDRVLAYVQSAVTSVNEASPDVELSITVIDPIDYPSATNLCTNDGNPTYYHTMDMTTLAPDLQKLVGLVEAADCFLVVCPEYNHTIPPALTAIMNQVGCSKYANKVSGTVTYSGFSSAGGGARAAVALRPFLSELGCLPVSKQVIVPDANKVLDEAGEWVGEHKDGAAKTMADMLGQLTYFADALAAKKEKVAEAKAAAEAEAKA